MRTVAGIFNSRSDAERAAERLQTIGIAANDISILIPGTTHAKVEAAVATSESEQPGMGAAMGGVVGGAMGVAGGVTLGAAAASLLVPGVGPVIAAGIIGAALMGASGAALGSATGGALEESIEGLPHDELYVYEDALRKQRTVVIAVAADELQGEAARNVLLQAGAESIDAARDSWWVGLRDVEEVHYTALGKNFKEDEAIFLRGFESAMHPHARGKSYQDRADALHKQFGNDSTSEAFKSGFTRGQQYHRDLQEKYKS